VNAEGKTNDLLTNHSEYLRLGRSDIDRRAAYRALFKAQLDEAIVKQIREATNGNYALGSSRFQDEVARMLGRRVVKGKAGRPKTASTDPNQMNLFD
jgi:putative transposase